MIEDLLAKVTSLPVQNYNSLANHIVLKMVNNTDPQYHSILSQALLQIMETLFEEKKRGKQESFKSKILYKLSYLIALIVYKTQDSARIDLFNKISELFL